MSDKELMTLSASEQDECRQYIAWTTGGPEPDWKNMATWLVKCADNRKQNAALRETIARLEREKGMLVAVAEASKPVCDFSMQLIHDNLEPKIAELNRVLVAAIDGGALEVE